MSVYVRQSHFELAAPDIKASVRLKKKKKPDSNLSVSGSLSNLYLIKIHLGAVHSKQFHALKQRNLYLQYVLLQMFTV